MGRAIRDARIRRAATTGARVALIGPDELRRPGARFAVIGPDVVHHDRDAPAVIYTLRIPPKRPRRWREIAAIAVALSVALAFLIGRQTALPGGEAGSTSASPSEIAAVPLVPLVHVGQQSRGLTRPGAAPVVTVDEPVPSKAPEPTAEPAAAPPAVAAVPAPVAAPAPGPQGTGAPGGSAGTGAGTGVGAGSGDGSGGGPAASPAPTPRPAAYVPLDLPAVTLGYYRIGARITDATTRQPLADVCVIVGTDTCGPDKPRTNEAGVWYMDVPRSPTATEWDIRFVKSGYMEVSRRVVTASQDVWLELGVRRSR